MNRRIACDRSLIFKNYNLELGIYLTKVFQLFYFEIELSCSLGAMSIYDTIQRHAAC